ncbi:MAG: sialate O-acetylesterase [Gracilimonas sp.]
MTKFISLSIVFLLTFTSAIAQNLTLPLVFSDQMVLQRDADIRVWGWADAGTKVSVQVGEDSRTTTADFKEGRWETLLPAQKAGGPFTFSISAGEENITLKDVYIGDVWVAGGQSNMEWKLNWEVENWKEEVANSGDYPEIRFFDIPQTTAYNPQVQIPGGEWKIANPDNAGNFSAVAWYFAKLNHAEKDVPVGIIESNWGGTPAESWTPATRLLDVEGYQAAAKEVLDPDRNWDVEFAANEERIQKRNELVGSPELGVEAGVHKADFDDSNWDTVTLPTEEPLTNVSWLRKSFTVEDTDIESANFFTGDVYQVADIYINENFIGRKDWQEASGTFSIDTDFLKTGTNQVALRVTSNWNNRIVMSAQDEISLTTNGDVWPLTGDWKFSNSVEPEMPEIVRYAWTPGFLYNAMIHPLAGYSIKGAIWYQGESNVGANQYYNELFEAMIEEWRKSWNQDDFPFLFVQLANYLQKRDEPYDSGWARLREAQTQTLSLANTGMATIIDIGDADDIHPRNKHDVGKRLWLAAEKVAYSKKLVYSGPMYRGHVVEGNKIRIAFDHAGSGLSLDSNGKRLGFAIAGSDREFHWPSEVKIEGNQVVVWSKEVDHPAAVRYAWADNPDVSLYNLEGLPGVPFRTDDW